MREEPTSYVKLHAIGTCTGQQLIKHQATSNKLQASSLTGPVGDDRMNLERNNMDKETNGHLYIANDNLKRIADALDEILRLVKEDQEKMRKIHEEN